MIQEILHKILQANIECFPLNKEMKVKNILNDVKLKKYVNLPQILEILKVKSITRTENEFYIK